MYKDTEYSDKIYGEIICASCTEESIIYKAYIGDSRGLLMKKSDLTQLESFHGVKEYCSLQ